MYMHDSRKFLLLVVAILALVLAPAAFAQDQGTPGGQQQDQDMAQDRDQSQQRARDQIHVQDPDAQDADVEIAHNDDIDEDGDVTHDDRLRVETVFSNGPGWLVVYAASGAQDQARDQDRIQDPSQDQDQARDQDQDRLRDVAQCGVAAMDGQDADAEGQAVTGEQDLAQFGIVGYAHLQNGVNRGIEVPVDASRATQVLCLQVHRDAGEIGVFEFPGTDTPATGGLLINVAGGLLDEQGQLITEDTPQDQADDQDDQDDDQNGDDDQIGDGDGDDDRLYGGQ
jgi:hypothetical protein